MVTRARALSVSLLALTSALALNACAQGVSRTAAGDGAPAVRAMSAANQSARAVAYRRLTESQYRHAIADVFGPEITINARFEPERREERLQAVGNAQQSITTSGLEQYYSLARSIADQVVDGENRAAYLGCEALDSACAAQFVRARGAQLFRRPLTTDEAAYFDAIYAESAAAYENPDDGLKQALVALLMSPEYLFRVERAEPDPNNLAGERLDAWTKASRLSFMLWDAGPDAALLEAARTGEIHTEAGLARQIERMLVSPRLEDGVRALFTDILQFEYFDTLSKDSTTYPKFSGAVAASAREETLRFLVDHLVRAGGDYRDIFTSRETEIDRTLAYVYNVPFLSRDEWADYTFPEDSERSGIVSQVTFLSLFSHPGSSSPTVRGMKLQEIFRCLKIPDPPPDVDFSKVQALEHGTVRVRLTDHMTNPGCAGCHTLTDPMGLALERFDGLGQHRTMENGLSIDVTSQVEGREVSGAPGVGAFLHDDPQVTACLVQNVHYYGVGRPHETSDDAYLAEKRADFEGGGYRLDALYRSILTDPHFYAVPVPQDRGGANQTAQLSAPAPSLQETQ